MAAAPDRSAVLCGSIHQGLGCCSQRCCFTAPAPQPELASLPKSARHDVSFLRSDSRCRRCVSDLSNATPKHRCRRQILGVRRNFVQTCPKWHPKKTAFRFILGTFFQIKAHQRHFCPNLSQLARKKHDFQKNEKNVCTLISDAIFVKSKHIKRFCEGFHTFCPDLRLHPRLLHHWPIL